MVNPIRKCLTVETAVYRKKLPFISIEEKQSNGYKVSKDKFILLPIINITDNTAVKPLLVYHSENLNMLKSID